MLTTVLLLSVTTANKYVGEIYDLNKAEILFEKFVRDYNKKYKDEVDRLVHFINFKKNLLNINELNRHPGPPGTAVAGINSFTDLSPKEMESYFGFLPELM